MLKNETVSLMKCQNCLTFRVFNLFTVVHCLFPLYFLGRLSKWFILYKHLEAKFTSQKENTPFYADQISSELNVSFPIQLAWISKALVTNCSLSADHLSTFCDCRYHLKVCHTLFMHWTEYLAWRLLRLVPKTKCG